MSQNKANINDFPFVFDFCNDAIFIASDIKNYTTFINVGVIKSFSHIRKIIPYGFSDCVIQSFIAFSASG